MPGWSGQPRRHGDESVRRTPLAYAEAEKLAAEAATSDSAGYAGNSKLIPKGSRIGEEPATGGYRP